MPTRLRAPRMRPGDCVAVVSPSWGGAGAYPHRVARGKAQLEALGFRVRIAQHALGERGFVSDTPENRADDIHAAFRDPEVKMVLSAIGGDHSCHLLPLLDFELIRRHPKVFLAYSDTTVLSVAIWQETRLVTFYGPALLTDFAEYPEMFEYTRESLLATVGVAAAPGPLLASTWWTEEYLDWGEKRDLERPRRRQPSQGWWWLRSGAGEGTLVGGCLESLQHLRGTRYWPDLEEWERSILFFETSNLPPEAVDGVLMDYENMGVLERVQAILVGRAAGYTPEQREELRRVLLERTARYDLPIVTELDFGHTDPKLTLPIGSRARVDCGARRLELVEAAVE